MFFRTRKDPASTYGWMRRPELDTPSVDCWELPDGTLWAAPRGEEPMITRSVWRKESIGDDNG